ncbi:MAG: anhydro-N-acetylmuramic acid kinase [Gemmatimonadaceae bacterium]|nr:anhydro-N-acetylmuramic acid kinase [Acetobacteraceae bacterium]
MRTALGLMSGTSADGVDAALIETDGLSVRAFGPSLTVPYAPALRRALLDLMHDPARAAIDTSLDAAVTDANADAARTLLERAGSPAVDVVGMHGQTVLHRPDQGFTRQLGDGEVLRRALGIPVVSQFRHADVAAGGQGAPLAPAYHQALARGMAGPVVVLNLGGVANVTVIDGGTMLAFDTGPASALLDDWVGRHTGAAFDEGGRIARSGTADAAALATLLAHPFFDHPPPKSLDRNSFAMDAVAGLSLIDGAATLLAFTVASVALARRHMPVEPLRWLVGGGGRHNAALVDGLRDAIPAPVEPVEAMGWDGDALEAQAFGFLAVRSLLGLPLSWPETTRAPRPMPGGVLHGD